MITLTGLTELQREIADRIWQLDTAAEVEHYISSMPKRMQQQAWVVMQMIIAAELDQVMEVEDAVKDYCRSL